MKQSYWLREIEEELTPLPALNGELTADIAIIGGGFVGLWSALLIKEKSPTTKVVILEMNLCGSGASGRNGGLAMTWWPRIELLIEYFGQAEALRLAQASEVAIAEIGTFCQRHQIDAHFHQKGWIWTATTDAQKGAWSSVQQLTNGLGFPVFKSLTPQEVASRTGSDRHMEGIIEESNATVQPACLARGLMRVALEEGVHIYENSKVVELKREVPAQLITAGGSVMAKKVIIANNAWASTFIPELTRTILPVTSSIIATEPIPEKLAKLGWNGGEAITDSQLMVDYYRTTQDGRIIFGKGTGAIVFRNIIKDNYGENPALTADTQADFKRIYPMLNVDITDEWTGPVDRTYDSLPVFGHLKGAPHIIYGVGWSGNGVAPSRIGGKILSSLALDLEDEWSSSSLVNRTVKQFPYEPLRYLGGSLVRQAVRLKGQAEANGKKPHPLWVALEKLAPDKN